MSFYTFGTMAIVVFFLGIVVSLIVMGGIADADQQAKRLESERPNRNGMEYHKLKSGEGTIL